jgi:hypothetical protein
MAYSTEDDKAGASASRQVYRQAGRDNEKHKENERHKTDFPLWWRDFQGSELLPGVPPSAPVMPGSSITADGKVPAKLTDKGWVGFRDWPNFRAELCDVKQWHGWGANVLLQTRIFHAIDVDVEDEKVATEIEKLAFEIVGDTSVRFRTGSARRLLLCRIKDGIVPLRKRRLGFLVNGTKQFLEGLAFGQQTVVGGLHKSGATIQWRNGHPCERGPSGVPEITSWEPLFDAVTGLLDMYGYPVVSDQGSTTAATTRRKLTEPSLHAPKPQYVLDIFAAVPCNDTTVPGRQELVPLLISIKASLGNHAQEFWPTVLKWVMQHPDARDADYIATIWNSIFVAEIGYSWFEGWARSHGYTGDAQQAFDDGVTSEPKLPENPIDRMLARFVWCQKLERYVDLTTGEMLSPKAFNAHNVAVAAFGRTGVQSAEAEFQNNLDARKAVMATYRPARGELITDTNERGRPVQAVNLWRPSTIVPAQSVSENDVRPWLDHVEAIFGPLDGPAASHFLDFVAFLLQQPGVKINHALVIFGEVQGTGKDTVFVPIFRAIGMHNVSTIGPETLASPWTHFLLAQVVRVEEMMNFSRREVANKLKPMLATPPETVQVNIKNVKQYDIPNNQNYVMFTNYEDAIPIEGTDRRYWVHRCCLDAPREPEYYARLYNWLENGGVERVAGWLMQRDLSAFNPLAPPPNTEAKRAMLEASQPAPVRWVRGLFAEGDAFADRTVVTISELPLNDFHAPPGLNPKYAATALKAEGFRQALRVKINGDARQLWVRDVSGAAAAQSSDELRERYLAELRRKGGRGEG